MSLHLSKCHIVGNHMSRPKCQNQSARLKCLVWHKHDNVSWHSKRYARYGLKDLRSREINRKLSQRKWPFLFSRVSLLVRDNLSPKAARTVKLPFYNSKRCEQGFHTKGDYPKSESAKSHFLLAKHCVHQTTGVIHELHLLWNLS